jgi:hypothetical protein
MLKLTDPPLSHLYEETLLEQKINSMEIFCYDCNFIKDNFSGNNLDCNCGLLKISSNGINGWKEYRLSGTRQHFDLIHFASVFEKLKGLSVFEGIRFVQSNGSAWGQERKKLAESVLIDLAYKLQNPLPWQQDYEFPTERSVLFYYSQAYFSF